MSLTFPGGPLSGTPSPDVNYELPSRFSCSQVSADKDPEGLDLEVTWNVAGS